MITEVEGDLLNAGLNGDFDVIVHGCNCQHKMGAGIALQIARRIPEAFAADKNTPKSPDKLGTYSYAKIEIKQVNTNIQSKYLYVVNAYTQITPGRDARLYAIVDVLVKIKNDFKGKRIGLCRIGCGLGGLDWTIVKESLENIFDETDFITVMYI